MKHRSLEDRRASGEDIPHLPLIVGGRPSADELERPPRDMDKWARAAWREVVPQLVAAKLIDRVDRQALEAYCTHLGRARAIREAIEWVHHTTCECPERLAEQHVRDCRLGTRARRATLDEQVRARTTRGTSGNPLLSHEREALREARMMAELLGLNPVSRTRLAAGKPKQRTGLAGLNASLPSPRLAVVPDDPE